MRLSRNQVCSLYVCFLKVNLSPFIHILCNLPATDHVHDASLLCILESGVVKLLRQVCNISKTNITYIYILECICSQCQVRLGSMAASFAFVLISEVFNAFNTCKL